MHKKIKKLEADYDAMNIKFRNELQILRFRVDVMEAGIVETA